MRYLFVLATLATMKICSEESLEQWVCDKISEYNVPDPAKADKITDKEYYFYLLGYKHAYKDMLDKVRGLDIEELEMAD